MKMQAVLEQHKKTWTKLFIQSVLVGVFLLMLSMFINHFSTSYASERVSHPVTDVILSNIRVFNVDDIIVYGALALTVFILIVTFFHPRKLPFSLKSLALFIVIRSIFISLTHLGPFSPQAVLEPTRILNFLGIATTADLFFSGHTGIPFLFSLIYWDNKYLHAVFLAISVLFATSVLLGHLHYSIDVFAAYFITYTIFHISQKFFAEDWEQAEIK